MSKKFTIRGKTYDLEDAADVVSIQNALVPENWPGKKADCVRLFLALQDMLSKQIARHLAANFRQISKSAQEELADGGSGKVAVSFAFEIDQTSPLVAALTKLKMSFSVKYATDGKPQTFDLTQGELPLDGDDMTEVMDVGSIARENKEAEAAAVKQREEEEAAAAAAKTSKEGPPEGDPSAPATATSAPVGVDKKARKKKK